MLAQVGPTDEVTLWSATQVPHILRFALQLVLGIPESKIRVIAPDVGGGFGSKLDVYAEEDARGRSCAAARPAREVDEERAENYMATIHGRDVVTELTFAATKDGTITAVKAEAKCAMGAYLQLVTPGIPLLGAWIYSGPYAIPNYSVTFTGVFTQHDADGRISRRRSARGDVRARADDGRARARARHGSASSFGGRTSSRSSRTRWRRGSRSTPATTTRRSTACSSSSIWTRSGPSRPSAASGAM